MVLHFASSFIWNTVPLPSWLLQETFPPIYWIICLQIESPNPVPHSLPLEFSANLLKLTNNFFRPSLDIPFPVSIILISKLINFSISPQELANSIYDECFFNGFRSEKIFLASSSGLFFSMEILRHLSERPFLICSPLILIITVIRPFTGVNLSELEMKFIRICCILL